ncbi:hypothetical protein BD560DRAFT_439431 [Blakeslea trispora]|nr:hypothetical protein BD560DRAFT_439431 [Blakeslea trispora]
MSSCSPSRLLWKLEKKVRPRKFMSFVSSIVVEATICKSMVHQKAQVRLGLVGNCKDRIGQANAISSFWCLRMIP